MVARADKPVLFSFVLVSAEKLVHCIQLTSPHFVHFPLNGLPYWTHCFLGADLSPDEQELFCVLSAATVSSSS